MREVAMAQAADARADSQLMREAPPPLTRAEKKNLEADIQAANAAGPPPPPTDQYRRAEIEADQQAWNRLNASRIAEERRLGLRADAEARYGSLDDNLRRVEARALQLAQERRSILLQMNASRARDQAVMEKPPRAARIHGDERNKRLERERRALMRTPAPTSHAIGNHAPYTKSAPKAGVGKGGFSEGRAKTTASSFRGAVPGFDVAGQEFVDQFAGD